MTVTSQDLTFADFVDGELDTADRRAAERHL
jgi:anti-sigma factor RsiW